MTSTLMPNGLSVRANNCILAAGIKVEKESVLQAVLTGKLSPHIRPRNYGKKTHREICRWLRIPESLKPSDVHLAVCPCCGSVVLASEIKSQDQTPKRVKTEKR
jgi:hypothetical protein